MRYDKRGFNGVIFSLNLPTLVICDAGEDRTYQIAALVKETAGLTLVGMSTMHETFEKIPILNPKLAWIELTPDPDEGIKLLVGLKEKYPDIHCLVSNDVLDADLVKMTMQMGAVDFLDHKTMSEQLPEVLNLINSKENFQVELQRRKTEEMEKIRVTLETQKVQAAASQSRTNLRAIKKMRSDVNELESRAMVNLAMIVILVVLIAGAWFFFRPH